MKILQQKTNNKGEVGEDFRALYDGFDTIFVNMELRLVKFNFCTKLLLSNG